MILHLLVRPQTISPSSTLKSYELLHRITGEGLSVEYCFSRQPFSPDANMVAVQMQFTNNATSDSKNLHIEDMKLQSGMRVKEFSEIGECWAEAGEQDHQHNRSWHSLWGIDSSAADWRHCFPFVPPCWQSCCLQVRRPRLWWASISVTLHKRPTSSCGEMDCVISRLKLLCEIRNRTDVVTPTFLFSWAC